MKKKANISIGPELHRKAVEFAAKLEMDFSGLVAEALRKFMMADNATVPALAQVHEIALPRVKVHEPQNAPVYPRNGSCPCGSKLKYKKCCERITGPDALKLSPSPGYKRLAKMPSEKDTCPCGSGLMWIVCCQAQMPFMRNKAS